LYGTKTGDTQNQSTSTPPPPPGGDLGGGLGSDLGGGLGGEEPSLPAPPPPTEEGPGLAPESEEKNDMNILLENSSLFDSSQDFIDLSKGRIYLGEIERQLSEILKD